ncbi:MAG: glucose-1-phosphate adenylyltransferase [Myxococcota bacterium]
MADRGQTLTVVLGGGRGTRLYPLTLDRAKPAVPLGGKYRLIDIPLSNAINSGLRQVFVLTQFNSASLNAHIARTYRFDMFTNGFIEVLAAEQTDRFGADWYQGTADAVRKHLHRFVRDGIENILILSGDHLYRMRYDNMLAHHTDLGADITVATIPVTRQECEGFGVLATDTEGLIQNFKEKPATDEDISAFKMPSELQARWGSSKDYLASMGVYVFKAKALQELLAHDEHIDFGKDILPSAIGDLKVAAYQFTDYWEDIGTIKAFYDSNLALCDDQPQFEFYVPEDPIYTRARFLPPSRFRGDTKIAKSLIAEGSFLQGARVERSIIGQRSWLSPGSQVHDSIIMGADYYELNEKRRAVEDAGGIPMGIGKGVSIRRAIVDKNARIGADAVIHGSEDRADTDEAMYSVRDGIIIVKKNAVIEPGTVI